MDGDMGCMDAVRLLLCEPGRASKPGTELALSRNYRERFLELFENED